MPPVLAGFAIDELKHQKEKVIDCDRWCVLAESSPPANRDVSRKPRNVRADNIAPFTERLWRHGQCAWDDAIEGTTHQVMKFPIPALGVAFAAGALIGVLIPHKKTSIP